MLRKLGNLERMRSERSLTVEELARKSGVPRATIIGLEEATRRAQQTTVDKHRTSTSASSSRRWTGPPPSWPSTRPA
ncbi:MAG: helix-turn-helix domain-containing protein [Rubrobacter sp.]